MKIVGMFQVIFLYWDLGVCCSGVFVLLSPVAVVAGCELLVVTGAARVLLLAMQDISCRVIFLLSIGLTLIVVVTFSVIVFCCTVFFFFIGDRHFLILQVPSNSIICCQQVCCFCCSCYWVH